MRGYRTALRSNLLPEVPEARTLPPAPWSFARAEAFAMPFGKHRGKTLGELSKSGQGRGYLPWLAESNYGNAQKAAEIVLRSALGEEQP